MKVELCRHSGPTSIYIDAEILMNGDLQISGHDLGAAPLELMGDSDYEYWLTIRSAQKDRLLQFLQEGKENPVAVPSAEKDRLILSLLETHYHGDPCLVSNLKQALDDRSIPNEFFCY